MVFCPPPPPAKPPIVTIWVHGSKSHVHLPSFLGNAIKDLSQLLSGNTEGLHKITEFNSSYYPFLQAQTLATVNPLQFNQEHFYVFGWSGKVAPEERKNAAFDLFNALKSLTDTYQKQYNCLPKIILISHSHGGNVVLHLAEIVDPDGFTLQISKAILLACPVQKHTAHLINSSLFTRIYSLHSHTDILQIIDPQGLHNPKKITRPLLSSRHFDINPKLAQALIRWKQPPVWTTNDFNNNNKTMKKLISSINVLSFIKKNRGLLHVEFLLLPFIYQLPTIIEELDKHFDDSTNCPSHKDHDLLIEL